MFARFDENPAMTLRVIKETKRYGRTDGRTHGRTHARTDGQRENSIPPTNKVCGGYNYNLENSTCEPLKHTMGSHILIVSIYIWENQSEYKGLNVISTNINFFKNNLEEIPLEYLGL